MKDLELRLLVELMKNSRRSDRELAKTLGVSQPTISRTIKRLEKEGYIREYTIIPDFAKMGYTLLGLTLIKRQQVSSEKVSEIHKGVAELEKRTPYANLMAFNGMGFGRDALFATFYKGYAEYARSMEQTRNLPFIDVDNIESFLVNVSDPKNFRLLSMSKIANHSLMSRELKDNES